MGKTIPILDRFWPKVDATGECWLWTAQLDVYGYGVFRVTIAPRKQRSLKAHRVAYELAVGAIPDGFDLDHLCRTPACVNPRTPRASDATREHAARHLAECRERRQDELSQRASVRRREHVLLPRQAQPPHVSDLPPRAPGQVQP